MCQRQSATSAAPAWAREMQHCIFHRFVFFGVFFTAQSFPIPCRAGSNIGSIRSPIFIRHPFVLIYFGIECNVYTHAFLNASNVIMFSFCPIKPAAVMSPR